MYTNNADDAVLQSTHLHAQYQALSLLSACTSAMYIRRGDRGPYSNAKTTNWLIRLHSTLTGKIARRSALNFPSAKKTYLSAL